MLVLMLPRVSSRVSGFPVASPCLRGKLQNLSFLEVSNCETWRMSRTTCSFWCSHVSRFESLVFLWPRRVYGGSFKTSPFRRSPSRLSCRFAWQAWHFVAFQPASKLTKLEEVLHEMLVLLLPRVSSGVSGFQSTLYTLHSTLYTPHSTLYSLHSAFYTSQFPLHASHSTLYIPHFTLCIPHSTLYTLHFRCTRLCK